MACRLKRKVELIIKTQLLLYCACPVCLRQIRKLCCLTFTGPPLLPRAPGDWAVQSAERAMSVPANTTGFPRQALIKLGLQIGLINILGGGKVLAVRFVDLIHIVHQIRKVACDIVHVVNVEIDPSSSCPGRFVLGGVCVCVASAEMCWTENANSSIIRGVLVSGLSKSW